VAEHGAGGEPASAAAIVRVLLLLAVGLGASFPYFERFMNANERPRLLQGVALVEDGSWAVDGPSARGIDAGIDVARADSGELVPNKPPGASVVAAVAWTGARATSEAPTLRRYTWVARMLGGLVPVLLIAAIALRRLRREHDLRVAVAAVTLLALATPIASYGRLLFGHTLAAALLYAGTSLLVDATGDRRRAALGGALAASAVAVEYTAAFAGLPIAIFLLARVRRGGDRRVLASAIAGALAPIVLLALYHDAVFGSPFSTPYHHVVRPEFAQTHGRGLLGLGLPTPTTIHEHLLSAWGGALWWAAVVLVGFIGHALAWREGRASDETKLHAAILATVLVVDLGLAQGGGWRVGPRYLVVAMPMAASGLAFVIARARTSALAGAAVIGVALWQCVASFLAANLFPHPVPTGNPLADLFVPLWQGGYEPYNVLGAMGLRAHALWAIALVGVGLPAWALVRALAPRPATLAAGLALAVGLFGVHLSLPSAADADATLASIERIWEPKAGPPAFSRALGP
jgi:hypothetical protein